MVSQPDAARAAGFSSAIDRIALESLPCALIDHPSGDKYRRSVARRVPPAVAAAEVREVCGRLLRPCSCDAWIGVSCGDHSCDVCVPAVQNETHAMCCSAHPLRAAQRSVFSACPYIHLEKRLMMSTRLIYSSMVVWFAMVTALVGVALFAGVRVTLATCAVALAVGLMPPAMMVRLRVPAEGRR